MGLSGSYPLHIRMQRQPADARWGLEHWRAQLLLPGEEAPAAQTTALTLELHDDEAEGYFENWVAPAPKVFVTWRLRDGLAVPILASVSYAEGTRMFDSGDPADGLPMPPTVHAWLGEWLRLNYRPRQRRRHP